MNMHMRTLVLSFLLFVSTAGGAMVQAYEFHTIAPGTPAQTGEAQLQIVNHYPIAVSVFIASSATLDGNLGEVGCTVPTGQRCTIRLIPGDGIAQVKAAGNVWAEKPFNMSPGGSYTFSVHEKDEGGMVLRDSSSE